MNATQTQTKLSFETVDRAEQVGHYGIVPSRGGYLVCGLDGEVLAECPSRDEARDAADRLTAQDWCDYIAWADEDDAAWWARQNRDWHDLDADTPLDVLTDAAPFDEDEPDPSLTVDWDELYAERRMEEYPASTDIGHPAWE